MNTQTINPEIRVINKLPLYPLIFDSKNTRKWNLLLKKITALLSHTDDYESQVRELFINSPLKFYANPFYLWNVCQVQFLSCKEILRIQFLAFWFMDKHIKEIRTECWMLRNNIQHYCVLKMQEAASEASEFPSLEMYKQKTDHLLSDML